MQALLTFPAMRSTLRRLVLSSWYCLKSRSWYLQVTEFLEHEAYAPGDTLFVLLIEYDH